MEAGGKLVVCPCAAAAVCMSGSLAEEFPVSIWAFCVFLSVCHVSPDKNVQTLPMDVRPVSKPDSAGDSGSLQAVRSSVTLQTRAEAQAKRLLCFCLSACFLLSLTFPKRICGACRLHRLSKKGADAENVCALPWPFAVGPSNRLPRLRPSSLPLPWPERRPHIAAAAPAASVPNA